MAAPLKGFSPDISTFKRYPWATLVHDDIKWNDIENNASDGVEKIEEYCNRRWSELASHNVKVIPRVYLEWPGKGTYWPSDMTTGDYTSPQFKQRLVRMIEKLGDAWDNDPRVAFVETGLIGQWGEQHDPTPSPEIQKLMGDAYTRCFKHKLLMNRYPWEFTNYSWGTHWDSWGTREDTDAMIRVLESPALIYRWTTAPRGGEVSYNFGGPPGASPDDSLTNHVDEIVSLIRLLHWNSLCWIAEFHPNNSAVLAGAARVQDALGYRFLLREFECAGEIEPGRLFDASFTVVNTGSAPFYYDWPVKLALLDTADHKVVWNEPFRAVDIRHWLPGDHWNTIQNRYDLPAASVHVTGTFTLPSTIHNGRYIIALAIVDPAGGLPAVRLGIRNYLPGGWQPLANVGVGKPIDDHAIPPRYFSDPANDTSLHYFCR